MSRDTLSEVLRAVQLRGAVFFHVHGTSPWAAAAPRAAEVLSAVLPDAEHMFEFHGVLEGSCWATLVDGPSVHMKQGDVVLFPQGDAHVMSSGPSVPSATGTREFFFGPRPHQLPFDLRVGGSGGEAARLVCGFLGLDARPFNPLLAALPRILHVTGESLGRDSWVASLLSSAAVESNRRSPGGEAVLERMSEMLFVEVLRRYVDGLAEGETGWLAGMRDPAVGRVLALLHEKPDAPWTIERLAEEAAVSRSTLHDRFVHFIGQPPMQYLAQWRMQLAARRLRDTSAKIVDVAVGVGYESEAAFSRAFKRATGVAPGAWRIANGGRGAMIRR